MLTDNGVCCVHEFDDMDINNQVSDHLFLISTEDEFSWTFAPLRFMLHLGTNVAILKDMEQQTIITIKAGIQATF